MTVLDRTDVATTARTSGGRRGTASRPRSRPFVGGELPVRLTAWDGSVAGPVDAPLGRHPLAAGAAPDPLAPGRARRRAGLRHRRAGRRGRPRRGAHPRVARSPPSAASAGCGRRRGAPREPAAAWPRTSASSARRRRPGQPGRAPRPAAQPRPRPAGDPPPLRPLQRVLLADPRPAHGVLAAATGAPTTPTYTVEDAQRDKLDAGLPQARARSAGDAVPRRRLRLGLAQPVRRGALRCAGHRRHHRRRAEAVHRRSGSASAACRTGSRSGCRTTARSPAAPFDAVASLEMGEHVGQRNYAHLREGVARQRAFPAVGSSSSRCRDGAGYPGGGPFIESFIAPDMHMRPVGETVELIESGGLEVRDVHALREHYVRTVDAWYRTFEDNWDRAVGLVGEEVVARLAALPRRRRDGLPRRSDGRRPDPRGPAGPRRSVLDAPGQASAEWS